MYTADALGRWQVVGEVWMSAQQLAPLIDASLRVPQPSKRSGSDALMGRVTPRGRPAPPSTPLAASRLKRSDQPCMVSAHGWRRNSLREVFRPKRVTRRREVHVVKETRKPSLARMIAP